MNGSRPVGRTLIYDIYFLPSRKVIGVVARLESVVSVPGSRRGRTCLRTVMIGAVTVLLASMVFSGVGSPVSPATASGVTAAGTTATVSAPVPAPVPTAIPAAEVAQLQHRISEDERAGVLPRADLLLPNLAYSDVREGAALVPSNL